MRDSSAKMSSYWCSRWPTISEKLHHFISRRPPAGLISIPCFIVDLVAKARCVNDGERDAGSFLVQFELWGDCQSCWINV